MSSITRPQIAVAATIGVLMASVLLWRRTRSSKVRLVQPTCALVRCWSRLLYSEYLTRIPGSLHSSLTVLQISCSMYRSIQTPCLRNYSPSRSATYTAVPRTSSQTQPCFSLRYLWWRNSVTHGCLPFFFLCCLPACPLRLIPGTV